jgi:hypothetical protein
MSNSLKMQSQEAGTRREQGSWFDEMEIEEQQEEEVEDKSNFY